MTLTDGRQPVGDARSRGLNNQQIAELFQNTEACIQENSRLRRPQIEGHEAAVQYFASGGHRAVERIPVGCGKSGLITLLPFGIAKGRVLVIAPNLTIRDQLAADLDVTSPNSFYRRIGVLSHLTSGPFRAVLDSDANLGDAHDAHMVVTNIQQLASGVDRWLPHLDPDFFDLILVDEGHHNAAPTWQRVFEHFPEAKVLSLTATPFRADDQPVEGELIYTYTFREAMQRGYIKDITASNVAPREIYFTHQGDQYHHTLNEVLQMREEDWYSRGIALARECNISIVDASIQWLEHLRETGFPHQIIAVACSLNHARDIRGLYSERGLVAREIHSEMPAEDREEVLRDLRNGDLDVIVQVQMLGEGFDHPPLSVAAIFRPFRSLNPYIQFVGRIMRANIQNSPTHPDNRGIVITHVGLNIDRHWTDFKYFDADDQELIREWLNANETHPAGSGQGHGRLPLLGPMDVSQEFIDRFISDSFLDPNDDTLIDNLLSVALEQGIDLAGLGIDREELRRRITQQRDAMGGPEQPQRLAVQPQEHRQFLRQRLNDQVKTLARRICDSLGQQTAGMRIAVMGGTGAANNLAAVIVLMNRAINTALGIESGARRELSLQELEQIEPQLEELADGVEEKLREEL